MQPIEQYLRDLVVEQLCDPRVTYAHIEGGTKLSELGLDSLDIFDMAHTIEDDRDVFLDDDGLEVVAKATATFDDLVRFVRKAEHDR